MNDRYPGGDGAGHDRPVPMAERRDVWGSDATAAMLRALDIPYLALNPGASFRGLHDSLVNYTGNTTPQMLLCLHEESAVSIAHGYARAAGRMMGVVLHSNVGLMHASMSIFNAWCDRVPMLVLGATGPWDAARRRPWIDWIHTSSDQGALVRDYTKWDNQPASVPATCEALLRAVQIADTAPRGPTYVNLDSVIQETAIGPLPHLPDVARFRAPSPAVPAGALLDEVAQLLSQAVRPVILMGRSTRGTDDWRRRVELAETLQAVVLTDWKMPAAFPTDHPLHPCAPGTFLPPEACQLLRAADVVLALDWYDVAGALKQACGDEPVDAKIINVSPDQLVHRGWSMDYQGLPPTDIYVLCEPDAVVPLLLARIDRRALVAPPTRVRLPPFDPSVLSVRVVAEALNDAIGDQMLSLASLPLSWNGFYRAFRHPLDYLGYTGGGGVGAGPGLTVGAALALRGSDRIVAGVVGDGDFLMGVTAVWTAVRHQIPCLIIVANNRAYYNDVMHQEHMAIERGRPVENKWIGQSIDDPDVDLAAMARAQGADGIGPVTETAALRPAIEQGLAAVRAGRVCVIDVRVMPGYDNPTSVSSPSQKR